MDHPFGDRLHAKPRILVAPLDWGLGHATRCVPIARQLLARNCAVIFACEGTQELLLRAEFPGEIFLPLKGYRITYSRSRRGMFWKMLRKTPHLLKSIKLENEWLKEVVTEHKIDAVISDNRYGLYHHNIPSIFLTHQLLIKTNINSFADKFLQRKNYRYINLFTKCWVADNPPPGNIAGELSAPFHVPQVATSYIGVLSRLAAQSIEIKKNHLLIIISGPEPQRTIFEELILHDVSGYNHTATIVRGMPGTTSMIPSTNMLKFYNHLDSDSMAKEMNAAEFVISRSGYSTVMDCITLQRKMILVPTPGQTEQEYLGLSLMEKELALSIQQEDFSLEKALEKAGKFSFKKVTRVDNKLLDEAIKELLKIVGENSKVKSKK